MLGNKPMVIIEAIPSPCCRYSVLAMIAAALIGKLPISTSPPSWKLKMVHV
jgi:hypothetical protein